MKMNKIYAFCSLILIHVTSVSSQNESETKNLAQFGLMIHTVAGKNPLDYNGYGCWCGAGGSGKPVDSTDQCCQVHDRCYEASEAFGCSTKLFNYYSYNATFGRAQCNDPVDSCNYRVCMCDKQATECFHKTLSSYTPINLNNDTVKNGCLLGFEPNQCDTQNQVDMLMPGVVGKRSEPTCPPGTMKTQYGCSKCPDGHVCPCAGSSGSIVCEPGTISNGVRTLCVACAPGRFTGTPGRFCSGHFPDQCGSSSCDRCPAGHVCPASGTSQPIECQPGTVSNGPRTRCVPCRPGKYTSASGRYCSAYFPDECGGEACSTCPLGCACPGEACREPRSCPPGTIANGGRTECVPCAPGRYSDSAARFCSTYYGDVCGGEACTSCPGESVCPSEGTITPIKCPPGTAPNYQRTGCVEANWLNKIVSNLRSLFFQIFDKQSN
jgi:secretory phospholipase A2